MSAVEFLTVDLLRIPGVAHGFFTRAGGASQGVYASLNAGVGSRDAPEAVTENRVRIAAALGAAPERLAVPFQIHSPDALAIAELWPVDARPRCDALVTATPGLALGVTGADCGRVSPGRPAEMITSGRQSAMNSGEASRYWYPASAFGPRRAPEEGSARTGHPACSARPTSAPVSSERHMQAGKAH